MPQSESLESGRQGRFFGSYTNPTLSCRPKRATPLQRRLLPLMLMNASFFAGRHITYSSASQWPVMLKLVASFINGCIFFNVSTHRCINARSGGFPLVYSLFCLPDLDGHSIHLLEHGAAIVWIYCLVMDPCLTPFL